MTIFVGDKPSPKMKPGAKPFEGAACEQRLVGWILQLIPTRYFDFEYVAATDNIEVRLVKDYDIINQSDYKWPQLAEMWQNGSVMVALGNNASRALGKIPHFKLPHPSGLNRQINDAEFINNKLKECRKYIESQISSKY